MKVRDLIGPALDWAVAKCMEAGVEANGGHSILKCEALAGRYNPSEKWSDGGPIIEREGIQIRQIQDDTWVALERGLYTTDNRLMQYGPTPLIAAMRRYVASNLGDEIEIPEELK